MRGGGGADAGWGGPVEVKMPGGEDGWPMCLFVWGGGESPTDQLLAPNFGRPSSQHTGAPPGHTQRRKVSQTLCLGPVAAKPGLSPALPSLRLALGEAQAESSAKINTGYKYAGKFLHGTRATRTRCHRTSAHLKNSKRVKITLITEMPPAQGKGFAELGAHFLRPADPPAGCTPTLAA